MSAIVGLDLSLTSTGVAVLDTTTGSRMVERITSKGKQDAGLRDRYTRLLRLSTIISDIVHDACPDLVVIEQPAFSRITGHQHDRSGLWWLVLHAIGDCKIAEVAPTARAKYGTGKGNAGKDAVLAAVVRRYSDVEVEGNDDADALILAAMGARHLGAPIEDSLPIAHLAAMDSVKWPAVVGA